MLTPWGPLAISDAHVHFFSHGFFQTLAAQAPSLSAGTIEATVRGLLNWYPPHAPEELAAVWVEELDRHGVSRAVLIASVPGDESSVEAAVLRFPDRFWAYALVNPLAPGVVARAQAAIHNGGVRGLCLFPAMHGYSVADERVDPLLQLAASQPGVVVFVHCGVLSVGIRKKLGLPSRFDMRFSSPLDLHPVALRYPGLPFIVPHFGAGLFREALMLCDLCPNVYLDTSSTNSWTRYLTPPPDLEAVFRRALDVAGPERLLFGTDSSFFPRGWHAAIFEAQRDTLHRIGISAADAAKIFGGNLGRLLGAES